MSVTSAGCAKGQWCRPSAALRLCVCLLLVVAACASPAWADVPGPEPGRRTVRVRAEKPVGTCYKFWTVGNFNKTHLFVDPNFPKYSRWTSPFVTQANAVYLLGGRYKDQNRWFLGVGADGKVRADFTGMIAHLRSVRGFGFVPWIVLDNVPYEMSDPPRESFYGNTAPPGDERVWHEYVRQAVEAMVKAFGRKTVAKWWFRVGTEPDLRPGHWAGTKEEFLKHYDYTVDAVTRVLPEAKIGPGNILNPARSGRATSARTRWGLDIIDHAAAGKNYCTGKTGTRLDWFSCSWYARVGGSISSFDSAMEAMRKRLDRYPQFANVPIAVGEFAVLGDERGRRLYAGDTTEWSASFYAALADRVYAHNVMQVYEWDHATFGVMHPKGHVIGMLERLAGGKRLAVEVDGNSAARCGALAATKDGRLLVLLYNHRPGRQPSVAETVRLELRDPRMKAGQPWRLSEWAVDANRTVWTHAYLADCAAAGVKPLPRAGLHEGSPLRYHGPQGERIFLKNVAKYRKLAELPQTKRDEPLAVADGQATIRMTLPGHSVRFLELSPPP
ncbi:MAG TPA: hypothetical protein VNA25_18510 [Phycisphaerae bacterium]|nr:hypothetical protein [Phycisphaerae bacterium]